MKVFVVDDHPVVIEGYSVLLKSYGIKIVGSSTDGFGLLNWLENNECDIILLDLSMPYLSGIDVLKFLQDKKLAIKPIIVTSYCDALIIQKVIKLGAKGYVTKAESNTCIVDAIKAVHQGKTYYSEAARDAVIDMNLSEDNDILITDILSTKETEVMKFLVDGFDSGQISDKMNLSKSSIRTYAERIRKKLGVRNNIELTRLAIKHKTDLFLKRNK